jgi:hypothetical protein
MNYSNDENNDEQSDSLIDEDDDVYDDDSDNCYYESDEDEIIIDGYDKEYVEYKTSYIESPLELFKYIDDEVNQIMDYTSNYSLAISLFIYFKCIKNDAIKFIENQLEHKSLSEMQEDACKLDYIKCSMLQSELILITKVNESTSESLCKVCFTNDLSTLCPFISMGCDHFFCIECYYRSWKINFVHEDYDVDNEFHQPEFNPLYCSCLECTKKNGGVLYPTREMVLEVLFLYEKYFSKDYQEEINTENVINELTTDNLINPSSPSLSLSEINPISNQFYNNKTDQLINSAKLFRCISLEVSSTEDMKQIYLESLYETFLKRNKNIKSCRLKGSNNSCKVLLHLESNRNDSMRNYSPIICKCSNEFCFDCHEEECHSPCYCDSLILWKFKVKSLGIILPPGHCLCPGPNCGIPIQLVSGCNYLKCLLCKYEFCYRCFKYSPSHNHPKGGCIPNKPDIYLSKQQKFQFYFLKKEEFSSGKSIFNIYNIIIFIIKFINI